jgi:ABC-type nitrate/sulfonate/bicarbonate transport system permease component
MARSAPASEPGTLARAAARWGPPALLVGALVAGWEAAVRLFEPSAILLPAPSRIVGSLWAFRADAARHTLPTLIEAGLGFAISVSLAIALAAVMDRLATVRRALEPLLVASQTIPVVAIAPLFVLWFGFGLAPKVVVVVLVTFFPIVVGLLAGFRSVSPEATELLRSMSARPGQAFRFLRWPSALPWLFAGLRVAAAYAVVGAVFGEYVGAREGLGIWMQLSQNAFRTDLVFGAILLTAVLSIGLSAVVVALERWLIPWAAAARAVRGR